MNMEENKSSTSSNLRTQQRDQNQNASQNSLAQNRTSKQQRSDNQLPSQKSGIMRSSDRLPQSLHQQQQSSHSQQLLASRTPGHQHHLTDSHQNTSGKGTDNRQRDIIEQSNSMAHKVSQERLNMNRVSGDVREEEKSVTASHVNRDSLIHLNSSHQTASCFNKLTSQTQAHNNFELGEVDVDMNNFSMLNQNPGNYYDSINSSVGQTVIRNAKENIMQSSTSGPSALGGGDFSNQTSQTQSKYKMSANNSRLNQHPVPPQDVQASNVHQNNSQAQEQVQREQDGGFFLTGVNMQGGEVQLNSQEDAIEEEDMNPLIQDSREEPSEEQVQMEQDAIIEGYQYIAVVDSNRALSNDNCVVINQKQQSLTHLTSNTSVTCRVDSFVSKYEDVLRISSAYARLFTQKQKSDKFILNITDGYNTSNIGGFNISNFKMRFLNEYIGDIIQDYEQSFLGSFVKVLLNHMQEKGVFRTLDLYMSVTKFEGDSGFSLVQGDDQEELQDDVLDYTVNQGPNFSNGFNLTNLNGLGGVVVDQQQQMAQYQQQQHAQINQFQQQQMQNDIKMPQAAPHQLRVSHKRENSSQKRGVTSNKKNRSQATKVSAVNQSNGAPLSNLTSQMNQQSPQRTSAERKQQAQLKKGGGNQGGGGSLPEFKKITEMAEVFSAFTQANLRNRILKKKQTSLDNLSPKNTGGSSSQFDIKDDIILVQFKLVNKETDKTFNTFSILNVPLTSYLDMNISNLHEILIKQSQTSNNSMNKQKDYLPYNKSILTRILAPLLLNQKITYISHFTKRALLNHLKDDSASGLANGLFQFVEKIFGEKRFKKRKLNSQEALKVLQKKFSKEVKEIYEVIDKFRDGINSFETYTAQQAILNQNANKLQSFTLFHQILHFLTVKEDIQDNGGPLASSNFHSEEEIQKVIFDRQYLKYLKKKIKQEIATGGQMGLNVGGLGVINQSQSSQPLSGIALKLSKLQYVQYDCIKSELKEEYDKKVKSLKLKLNRKAMRDPSLLLFSQLTEEQKKSGNRTPMAGGLNQSFTGISSGLSHGQGRNMTATYHMKQRQLNQGLKDKQFSAALSQKLNEKDKFYEFYLKSAQKAIDIMRQQQQLSNMQSNSEKHLSQLNRTDYDITPSKINQSMSHQQELNQRDVVSNSAFLEGQELSQYSGTLYNQNFNSNARLKYSKPVRSVSSKRDEKKIGSTYQPALSSNRTQLNQHPIAGYTSNIQASKLQPLLQMSSLKNDAGLEMIEERIKLNKLNQDPSQQYSNFDRRTSASTYSRGISSQARRMRPGGVQSQLPGAISNGNQPFNSSKGLQSQHDSIHNSSSGKPQSELGRIKEFLPLRTQGKLKAMNSLLYEQSQQVANGTITNIDSQSHNEQLNFTNDKASRPSAHGQSSLMQANQPYRGGPSGAGANIKTGVLFEQRDMRRKPQTASRPTRQGTRPSNQIDTVVGSAKFMMPRTNSQHQPIFQKTQSQNFQGTIGVGEILNQNYMESPTDPMREYQTNVNVSA